MYYLYKNKYMKNKFLSEKIGKDLKKLVKEYYDGDADFGDYDNDHNMSPEEAAREELANKYSRKINMLIRKAKADGILELLDIDLSGSESEMDDTTLPF